MHYTNSKACQDTHFRKKINPLPHFYMYFLFENVTNREDSTAGDPGTQDLHMLCTICYNI